ncbi:MAG: hypothetical protein L3K25_11860 [Gammaproteobacteria bacterium]|nr:hypothetical protein [Gammaproteobacteria bacterium]MCF6338512.1 hypothetical protein [Gammaproteobacteria bacterium]
MSQFLHNIIYRHQAGNANREASYIVQPRPKSRFENTVNTGESLTRHDPKIESVTEAAHMQLAPDLRMKQNADNDNLTPLAEPEQTIFAQETSGINTQNQSGSPPTTKQPDIQKMSTSDGENSHIHTILTRLNSQHAQNNKPSPSGLQQNTTVPKTTEEIDNNLLNESVTSPFLPEQDATVEAPDFKTLNVESQHFADPLVKNHSVNQEGRDKKQTLENPLEQQETHQAGLLQTPDWLAEIQSSLTERWQALNAQTEPEPVINVTIGRVEVRAVQTDSPTQSQPDKKPSGVMSLSDYLEQRNKQHNKGQP